MGPRVRWPHWHAAHGNMPSRDSETGALMHAGTHSPEMEEVLQLRTDL
jgi:hypothetical protein